MVKNIYPVAVANVATFERQAAIKSGIGSNPYGFNAFDTVEISTGAKSASQAPQTKSQVQSEPSQRSNLFSDVFLSNVKAHGIIGAYNLAWSAMRSEFSIDSNSPAYSSEKQESISIDISAYY